MRIVQIANFITASSGGLRRTLDELALRYSAAGDECVRIVPASRPGIGFDRPGTVIGVSGPLIPRAGGYRCIVRRGTIRALLESLSPDVVESSDKTTLAWLPAWLASRGVPTVLISHERHDELLRTSLPQWLPWRRVIDGWTAQAAEGSHTIVCASAYAAAPFAPWADKVRLVPLGVDLDQFRPGPVAAERTIVIITVGRLTPEKRPDLAIETLRELIRRDVDARLELIGDGPLLPELRSRAAGLPVVFHGHIGDRARLVETMNSARIMLAPCPVETFGLAVLEGLACGLPIVVPTSGATGDLVPSDAGAVCDLDASAMADGVSRLVLGSRVVQRVAARRAAALYSWDDTADALRSIHAVAASRPRTTRTALGDAAR